jgi:uncharacterized protein
MIVVIDTNVVVSAFQFSSPQSRPALAVQRAAFADTLATCDEIDAEIIRVLVMKFGWPQRRAEQKLATVFDRALRVVVPGTLHLCRDPGDDKFLECAACAGADLLISGDKDLLSLRAHGRTRIVTPTEYLRI